MFSQNLNRKNRFFKNRNEKYTFKSIGASSATFALAFVLGLIGTKFIFSSSKCSLDVILLQAVASGGEDVEALL